jgi:serine/threonine protein kinase
MTEEQPKKIAEGAYGCVFKPAITSQGEILSNYINKIQIAKKATEKEPILGKKLKQIPHYRRYYAPSTQVSTLVLSAIDKQEIKKCEVLEKHPDRPMVVSKIPYVGDRTLGEQIEQYHTNLPTTTLSQYKSFQTHLEIAINHLLQDSIRIVHNDIKQNNIMYDDILHCPILIDFGLSFCVDDLQTPDQIKQALEIYSEQYPSSSIDIIILGKLVNKPNWSNPNEKLVLQEIYEIVDRVYETNPVYQTVKTIIGSEKTKQYKTKKKQYYTKIAEKQKKKTILQFVEALLENWDTWDKYSLYVMLFRKITQESTNQSTNQSTNKTTNKTTNETDPLEKQTQEYIQELIKRILNP